MQLRTKTLKETIDDLRAENAKLKGEIFTLKRAGQSAAPAAEPTEAAVIATYQKITNPLERARYARKVGLVSDK